MRTILIVDDEERIRHIYTQFFSNKGFEVITADSAAEANNILVKENVGIMLLDINMPEVDGSVLNEVTNLFHKEVKIIVCSVYPVDEQKQIIKDAADYYEKSQGLNELFEKVKSVLRVDERERILIVDDDPRIRNLFSRLLNKGGYRPIPVESAENALQYSKEHQNDIALIILDLAMPGVDGIDFFDAIKKDQPEIKVIISSVYPVDEQKALIFDADDYYDKADGGTVLLDKVKKIL